MAASLRSPISQIPSSNPTSAAKSLPPSDPPPIPIPPSPDPRPSSQPPPSFVSSMAPPANKKWTDLFATRPRNAGKFVPPPIKLQFSGHRLVPTEDILSASIKEWSRYLVGFFLDEALPFSVVYYQIKKHWNPKGAVKVKSNGTIFFFHFELNEDRTKVLESDPIIIRSKVFIIKEWDTSIGNNSARIRSVPIWLKLFDIPPLAWTQIGICWLATMMGKFLCMDENTEKLERLEYAKCMVEVNPDKVLPDEFTVLLPDETEHVVKVEYLWKPAICSRCKVFGHNVDNCNLPSVKQDKVAPKITPVDPINQPGYRSRVLDRRRERLNVFKRRQAWRKVHSLNQKGKPDRPVENDAVTPINIDEQVDSEDEMVNITLPPIDLHDPNIGPIYVSSGIPLTKFGQMSVTENEKHKGTNVLRSDRELEEGEISLLEEKTRDEFVQQIGDIVHGKSDKRQDDGGSAVATDAECNATDSVDTRAAVNNQDTVNGEIRSNRLGEIRNNRLEHAVNQIEIAQVNEMLNAAFPMSRQENEPPDIQIQLLVVLDDQCKEVETEIEAQIRLITATMQEIERRLQAELDKRELNTKQFYAAKRSMKDFEEFKQRNALDQLDKARLDGVADLMKQMLESVNNKGKTSPSPKSKSPYAHLSAPPAYKERPPDIDTEPMPANSNEKPSSKTPITRSRKKEMLRILQENG